MGLVPKCASLPKSQNCDDVLRAKLEKETLVNLLVTACQELKILKSKYGRCLSDLEDVLSVDNAPFVLAFLQQIVAAERDWKKLENLVSQQFPVDSPPLVCEGVTCLNQSDLSILSLGPKFVFAQSHTDADINVLFERAAALFSGEKGMLTALKRERDLTVLANRHNRLALMVSRLRHKLRVNDVVVTKADKENRLVLMTRDDYVKKNAFDP